MRSLPAYRESLDARYPPVCASCLPGVRARISERDRSARASVLGGWLARSSSRSAQRDSLERAPGTPGKGKGRDFYVNVNLAAEARERAASRTAERIWTLRGVAWSASTIAGLVGSALGESCLSRGRFDRSLADSDYSLDTIQGTVASDRPSQVLFYVLSRTRWQRSRDPLRLSPSVPTSSSSASFAITPEVPPSLGARAFVLVLALISVFWTCWDPTWRRVARARRKGVRPAVTGREHWVVSFSLCRNSSHYGCVFG